jgi:hypothetical protein
VGCGYEVKVELVVGPTGYNAESAGFDNSLVDIHPCSNSIQFNADYILYIQKASSSIATNKLNSIDSTVGFGWLDQAVE